MRLIDADELIRFYFDDEDGNKSFEFVPGEFIDNAPTVEAEPNTAIETVNWYHQNADGEMVLGANSNQQAWFKADDVFKALKAEPTKHGRWIVLHGVLAGDDIYGDMGKCSNCGLHLRNYEWNYCPNCGAKMDEVEE